MGGAPGVTFESLLGLFISFCVSVELGACPQQYLKAPEILGHDAGRDGNGTLTFLLRHKVIGTGSEGGWSLGSARVAREVG